VEMKGREIREARQVFETVLGHRVGNDGCDDTRHTFPVVLFDWARGHARSVPRSGVRRLADLAFFGWPARYA